MVTNKNSCGFAGTETNKKPRFWRGFLALYFFFLAAFFVAFFAAFLVAFFGAAFFDAFFVAMVFVFEIIVDYEVNKLFTLI